mmetsp:Transcript_25805/g.60032  ORF Transcript_25805/g.60032 Transcript_25805/m.60032 type:complete len:244 (-) Transcript_25805:165-896(-)
MVVQPAIFASCPTSWPTAPLAALTSTVSPFASPFLLARFGRRIPYTPPYAVEPGMPSTPMPWEAVSSLTKPVSFQETVSSNCFAETAWTVVYGREAPRRSPGCHAADFDSRTRADTKPDTGPALPPEPDLIRDLMYGSALMCNSSIKMPPSSTSATGASVTLKCSGPGIPSSRGSINSTVLAGAAFAAAMAAARRSASTCGFLAGLTLALALALAFICVFWSAGEVLSSLPAASHFFCPFFSP